MRVKDVMVTSVAFCGPEDNLARLAELFWTNRCGALPVVDEGGSVLSIITDRDACIALGTRDLPASQVKVKDVSIPRFFSCKPEDDLQSALYTMAAQEIRRLPVVDAAGKLKGVLSIDDVILNAKPGSQINFTDVISTLKAIYAHRVHAQTGMAATA